MERAGEKSPLTGDWTRLSGGNWLGYVLGLSGKQGKPAWGLEARGLSVLAHHKQTNPKKRG